MTFYPVNLVGNQLLSNPVTVAQGGTGAATAGAGFNALATGGGTVGGLLTENGGTSTAGSAPVIAAPGFSSGVASQLSDLTRDYQVYIVIGTGGGTVTLAIGPTSGVANTVVNGAAGVNGSQLSVRLPAGWFLKITVVTSTIASQIAIGC